MFKDKPSITKKPGRPVKEKVTQIPLLKIELQDESSVPKVFYKGEEIIHKANVHFDWDTKDAHSLGGLTYGFEYLRSDGTVERIERRTKDHR